LQVLTPSQLLIRLRTLPGQNLAGEQVVTQLRFVAQTNKTSTFVPLVVSSVTGQQANGQPVPRALGSDGRVVYLGAQPLLETMRDGSRSLLILYGRPFDNYTLHAAPALTPPANWTPVWTGPLGNLSEVFTLTPTNAAQFFRAVGP
jgi:hypothetical protein